MNIPESVATCTVSAQMLRAGLDGPDADKLLQAHEILGLKVTLTPSRQQITLVDPSMELWLEPVVIGGNQAGKLLNHKSVDEPVKIVASQQGGEHVLEWTALVEAPGWEPRHKTFVAPAGGTVELSGILPTALPTPSTVFVGLTEPPIGSGYMYWLDASPTPMAPGMDPGTGNLTYYEGGR